MKKLIALAAIASFVAVCLSCDSINTNGKDIVFPEEKVSFQSHVYPFLKLNCSYSGCHSDETQAGGVVLTNYTTLFYSPGMVINGDPSKSRLVQIIDGDLPHFTFYYRGNITENHKVGVKKWITEGAKNN